ncbi:MAG: diaminopimelate decarboxylase [Xanthomonadales bacterium]|nr:diaminopimelate decarboxylase [Xanthomonadales bacterium]
MSNFDLLDGVSLTALAARIPTPFFAYSGSAISRRIEELKRALHGLDASIHFAVKANGNLAILRRIGEAGLGADIVSAGELQRCLRAGIPAARVVFSGVGKTADEMVAALRCGVSRFNVESHEELALLHAVAARAGVTAHASVRINPDVDARTHEKISTGRAENKFGVSVDEARRWFEDAASLPHLRLDGVHVHIGSQLLDLEPITLALRHLSGFVNALLAAGHRIECINVGGGLGVAYRDDQRPPAIADYVASIRQALGGFEGRIQLEPGRWLLADAGVLVSRVVRIKCGEQRRFLVLDAAMNDLMRPALYDAWHRITPLVPEDRQMMTCDVVGPVCETGDTFARDRQLPECRAEELVRIGSAGAYAASMSSTYNTRPLAAEVLLERGRYAIVRRRQSLDELLVCEQPANTWEAP